MFCINLFILINCIVISIANNNFNNTNNHFNNNNNHFNNNDTEKIEEALEVKVYYETLCYDSMLFIRRHLYPTWLQWSDNMDIKLVPYGKAIHNWNETTGEWMIDCQHGRRECALNIIHACILETMKFNEAFKLIECGMRGFTADIQNCARDLNIDFNPIQLCADSLRGKELFVIHGKETMKIDLSFVPSVAIDKKFDYFEQYDMLRRFEKIFCQKFYEKFNKSLPKCKIAVKND